MTQVPDDKRRFVFACTDCVKHVDVSELPLWRNVWAGNVQVTVCPHTPIGVNIYTGG